MARIRSIKPEFWTDETLSECSPTARLLFIATWSYADDRGNLERSSKQLKAQAFPYDPVDCESLVQELMRAGLLVEYIVSGKKFLHIKGFEKHQKIDKESKPRFPLYEQTTNTPRVVEESSPSPRTSSLVIGGEGNGEESKGVESSAREVVPRGTNIEADAEAGLIAVKAAYPAGIYPQNDWLYAEREARRRIDEGHTWAELILGCQRYAAQCDAKGEINSQYVSSPKKFFTLPDRRFREPFPLPAKKADIRLGKNISAAEEFMRRTEVRQ